MNDSMGPLLASYIWVGSGACCHSLCKIPPFSPSHSICVDKVLLWKRNTIGDWRLGLFLSHLSNSQMSFKISKKSYIFASASQFQQGN